LAAKANALGEMTQNNGHHAIGDHARSPLSVPMKSPYATSCTNSHPISYCSKDIAK